MGKKRLKKAEQQQENPNINEATRIRISQILEDFLVAKDEGELGFQLMLLGSFLFF